jgi:hypothetical protein
MVRRSFTSDAAAPRQLGTTIRRRVAGVVIVAAVGTGALTGCDVLGDASVCQEQQDDQSLAASCQTGSDSGQDEQFDALDTFIE